MGTKDKLSWREIKYYFFAFFIVSFTFQNFFRNPDYKLYIMLLFLGIFILSVKKIPYRLIYVWIVLSLIIIVQGLRFDYSPVSHITNLFINTFIPFVLLMIMPYNYHKYVIKVILFLSICSFVLWIGVNISPSFHNTIKWLALNLPLDYIDSSNPLSGNKEQIIIFTYEADTSIGGIIRNAGFCHEPGAYSVALIYAMVFNLFLTRKLLSKTNVFFIICILTTFSTAGYISFLLIIFVYLLNSTLSRKLVYIPILILAGLFVFSLDFMGDKISEQVDYQTNVSLDEPTSGRILGARKALYVLSKYPLTGRGYLSISKESDLTSAEAAGYGFMYYMAQVGFVVFFITIFLFNKTMTYWSRGVRRKKRGLSFIYNYSIVFIPILFAQVFIPSTLFCMLIFDYYYRNIPYKRINYCLENNYDNCYYPNQIHSV